uniref:Membrane transporter protein n=1 Tax=viral metagenome TaxID=1070528 RepID=A0A6C0IMT7_9ZZZZ
MRESKRYILTVLVGLISGIIGGATGLGGAFLIVPSFYILGVITDYSTNIGTTLFALLFPISILAVLEYAKNEDVDYKIGLVLTVAYILFSYLGSLINIYLKDIKKLYILKYFSAFILILCGIYFAYGAYRDTF